MSYKVMSFKVKDSGERQRFDSGMVRDTAKGKRQYHRVLEGPMLERWVDHMTKGAEKYPDNEDGSANWTKAAGEAELRRFRQSALRHFMQWYNGETDEDHAAAVIFNVNGAEYVKSKLPPAPGTITYEVPGEPVFPEHPFVNVPSGFRCWMKVD